MNETLKTILFVIVALLLSVAAWRAVPRDRSYDVFDDQGTLFYEEFEPEACASVEVIDYDDDKDTVRPFKVHFKNKRWTIPSHEDYPADAEEQLGETAGVVNGLARGALRSNREADFAELGVVDPLNEEHIGKGRGKRVILKSATGKVLTDLIIGEQVEGKSGSYYVRRPDSKRVYACKVNALGISTRFADWVETDLLDLSKDKILTMVLDNYRVEERTATKVQGDVATLTQKDGKWQIGGLKDNEEIDTDKVNDMARTLGALTLVGVRRKPAGLVSVVEQIEKGEKISRADLPKLDSLSAIGYYFGRDSKTGKMTIVSNEGELRVACNDGVRYTLLFGEVLYGEPDKISAARDKEQDKKTESRKGAEHRYVFVRAGFDESFIEKPEKPVGPEDPSVPGEKEGTKSEKSADAKPDGDKAGDKDEKANDKKRDSTAKYEEAKKEYDRKLKQYEDDLKDYEEKVKKGKERVQKLKKRFADWYYVISADAFRKLHLARKDLVKEKEEKKPEAGAGGEKGQTTTDDQL